MAELNQHLLMLIFLSSLLLASNVSNARPMSGLHLAGLLVVEPGLNIALPAEGMKVPSMEEGKPSGCNLASPITVPSASSKQKLMKKYKPLLFNVLPRGTIPPSGPSKGTNDMNN